MYDTEELAERIRDELDPVSQRLVRLFMLLFDIEASLGNGDLNLGAHSYEIELGLELAKELACAARRDLADVEQTCSRVLGEDDIEIAA